MGRQHRMGWRVVRRWRTDQPQEHAAIIDAIHTGVLASAPTRRDPVFGLNVVTDCPGVSSDIPLPREAWTDKADYDSTAQKLAGLFRENFRKYESDVTAEVRAASV